MKNRPIFYIDPQSYRNLSVYDYQLLSGINHNNIWYFHSIYYDHLPIKGVQQRALFAYNKKNNALLKALSYICSYLQILLYIVRYRPQIIHVQWFKLPAFDYFFFKITRQLLRFSLVHTAHNILPHDTGDRYRTSYEKLYKLSDSIIVHTNTTKNELIQQFSVEPARISVIPHGLLQLTIDKKKLDALIPQFKQKYQIEGKMVFTALGEQTYYKGIDILAKAWASAPELNQDPNCKLIIIGHNNGLDFSMLKNYSNAIVEDRRLSDEEFFYILTHTCVYLLPYVKISQSGALLTVLSTRTPVLVSEVGGLTEPLEIAHVGWKIQPNNPSALQKALIYIKTHPNEIRDIKENEDTWRLIEKHYNWESISKQTLAVYQSHSTCYF